ncbi:MAG: DUF3418 domain-containing protein, partial [Deltaproteobacteria bacterium]|nr:DUF3418 domain-containing protein [Deltaproteobacteria bacterium]
KVDIPEHLKMRVSITDHRGKKVASGRDPGLLRHTKSPSTGVNDSTAWKKAKDKWEKTGLTDWDFGSLPESIPLDTHLIAYPGLDAVGDGSVNIRLFSAPDQALKSHKCGVQALFESHFRKDLKFTKKSLSLSGKGTRGAEYFGGLRVIEKALYQGVLCRIFQKNVRSRDEFDAHARAVAPLSGQGKDIRDQTIKVLEAYHHTRAFLYQMENADKRNREVSAFCAQMRKDLDTLVPENFLEIYSQDRLIHVPRYLKAIQLRSERFAHDPEKDRGKFSQVTVFLETLPGMMAELSVHASREKRAAVEDYRWMIEEFKVSLFAQELKTPFPVSAKRLKARQKEIETMV